jgi:23S rRNA A2030 N6-methylase RlmJ
MNYDEKYAQQIKKINVLRESLRKNPGNKELAKQIQTEEDKLYFDDLNKSEWELERFLREHGVETSDDDED